ncbi:MULTISPECIES: helix-turn-helix domain-containing protein [Providencia]|uniref:helix-turn-helix domain-containing protein n=1 Tax=Providencia TaxID=586 RepID=UPI0032DAEBEC
MEDDSLFTVKEYAALLKLSESTVYRNPAKYHMFRVGRSWRASKESLKRFEQAQFQDDSVLINSEKQHSRHYNFTAKSVFASQSQVEKELNKLLSQRKRRS